ncbi:DNA binding domain protein, excisionase family (plasmid) [Ammonifex degensii KC4]|uniref:DNA binding domain protein, excisionase family n=1 Tax=Ammonifex degensii (strain DSM 10501 / KC4) TaxID=429009 RepID=C9RDI0_AMMDK|nr:helix-turn-helix domain-containing protein [Ammonifex degensii]ACX53251.1 DNA binding domain protein, excisionase family [Ammonifex degensii KC4]
MDNDQGLPLKEAAQALGISEKTLRRWIRAGKIPARLVDGPFGQEYRIPREAVNTAQQVVDVVKVERPTDPGQLAMAVSSALSRALEERDRRFAEELAEIRQQLAELLEVQRRAAEREEERIRRLEEVLSELRSRRRRPWWKFWGR